MSRGSFTIEASVIMCLIVTILSGFVFLALICHDRLVLYETALFHAAETLHQVEEPVSCDGRLEILRLENQSILRIGGYDEDIKADEAEEKFYREAEERLIVTALETVHVNVNKSGVVIRYRGHVSLPFQGIMKRFLKDGETIERTVRMKRRADPEEIVRLIGGLFRRD